MHSLPFFDDSHRSLSSRLDPFALQEISPLSPQDESSTLDNAREYILRLANARLLPYATSGAIRACALIRRRLARESALADCMFAMQGLGAIPILLAGTDSQKAQWLPRIEDGAITGFALTEDEAGSDPAGMTLAATPVEGGWRLQGEKTFISNAGILDLFTVFARTAPGDKDAFTAFVVDGRARRLTSKPIEVMSPHPIGRLAFDGVEVPDSARLGPVGGGLKVAFGTLDRFRATVGAAACGMAQRALDESLARARSRRQFGKPLEAFQAIQFMLADMATELAAADLLVARAAWEIDTGAPGAKMTVAMSKRFATDHAHTIIDRAVQIHGGSGVVRGAVVERLYRDVRALRIYEGTSEIQRLVIARELARER